MIVMVLENPEPGNPLRKNVDIEIRILVKGATGDEGELIGEVLKILARDLRPGKEPKVFHIDAKDVKF